MITGPVIYASVKKVAKASSESINSESNNAPASKIDFAKNFTFELHPTQFNAKQVNSAVVNLQKTLMKHGDDALNNCEQFNAAIYPAVYKVCLELRKRGVEWFTLKFDQPVGHVKAFDIDLDMSYEQSAGIMVLDAGMSMVTIDWHFYYHNKNKNQ